MNPPLISAGDGVPGSFRVRFETSRGEFVVEARRSWAPYGVDRFHELVAGSFFEGCRFFRVLDGFVAQFGISGDPVTSAAWRQRTIPDDPVVESNRRGRVTFAMAGPGTRTTQLFINLGDNAGLDGMGFAPIAQVVEGMERVDELYAGYGEGAPRGAGPDQGRIQREGEGYLAREFPRLDTIRRATVVSPA
ncbi:MAG TPA: peptidylprolyl isomerase [Gemmatimonadota bacterium]|nr:peptidylprolyl isomerase [Gemmatimonadota bacterium]